MSHKKKRNKPFQPIPDERALVAKEPETLTASESQPETETNPEAAQPVLPAVLDAQEITPIEAEVVHEEPEKRRRKRRSRKDGSHKKRRHLFWPIAGVALVALAVTAFFVLDVPNWQQLDTEKLTKLAQTSRIYDGDGNYVAALHGLENRTVISLSDVPVDVQNAFIAAEDLRFYNHHGFDLVRLFGAVVANLRSQSLSEGASTITQQLVKLTHLSEIKTFARKAEELYLSIQVESHFSKEQILEMYLNTSYFDAGVYGIEEAAKYYFGKPAKELTVVEGAALAATLKAPSAYNPEDNPDRNKGRRDYILQTMADNNMLDPAQLETLKAQELVLAEHAPTERKYGWFLDTALAEAEALLGITPDDLLAGGYYIETTLNTGLQQISEDLFANAKNFPADASDGTKVQGAMSVVDVKSGALVALVGGRDYAVRRGFNRAMDMKRQPGSAIKPLAVYAPAIEKGYTTASILIDERIEFPGGYFPRNSGNVYHGAVTARRALALSMNVATVRLMQEIGVSASLNFLKRAGIPLTDTDGNLSLALGAMTKGVSPTELASSYALFGNQGVYNAPYTISRISGPDGVTIYQHKEEPRTVLSAQDSYLMTSMMQSVTSWGTGAKLSATGLAVAGKTGTNSLVGRSGNRDVWMAAYTSDYSVACWMGFDNTDATHFLPSRVSGGDAPAAMATAFFNAAYKGKDKPAFKSPGGLVWLTIDTAASEASGTPMLAGSYTPETYKSSEVFLESNRPWQTSSFWSAPRACSYFYIDYEKTGQPKLVFGATDNANYRIDRVAGGKTTTLTEIYGSAGQTMTYTDWNASPGEWYTYRVTPLYTASTGTAIEGPASSQSVQAKWASGGLLDGVVQWFVNGF